MKNQGLVLLAIMCLFAGGAKVSAQNGGTSSPTTAKRSIPPVLLKFVGELRVSQAPVLMPTYIPVTAKQIYSSISEGPFESGYEWSLGTTPQCSSADTVFFMQSGKGKLRASKNKINIAPGVSGFFNSGNFLTLEWKKDGYCYKVGVPNSGRKSDRTNLITIAQSMVPVTKEQMVKAPKNEDRLKAAYQRIKETNDTDRLLILGFKYKDSIEAASKKDYVKAEKGLNELIANWQKCYEMPPLEYVKLFYAQVLRKTGRQAEATKIEQQLSRFSSEKEASLKKEIDELMTKQSGLDRGSLNELKQKRSKVCYELGDLYLAQGKYSDAEVQYREAFIAISSVFGAHSSDANKIARDYRSLLRLAGKSTDAVDDLMNQHDEKSESE